MLCHLFRGDLYLRTNALLITGEVDLHYEALFM